MVNSPLRDHMYSHGVTQLSYNAPILQPGPPTSNGPGAAPRPVEPSPGHLPGSGVGLEPGGPGKPTFPAYQQQPDQRPGVSGIPVATLPAVPSRPVAKVAPVGPNCKLIHPEEDMSLVSVAGFVCV